MVDESRKERNTVLEEAYGLGVLIHCVDRVSANSAAAHRVIPTSTAPQRNRPDSTSANCDGPQR